MPRRVAGGESGTQETRGQGGEVGNCGQVGHAGELPDPSVAGMSYARDGTVLHMGS